MKLNTSALAVLAALPLMSFVASAAPTAEDLQDRVFGSIFYEYYTPDSDKARSAEWQNVDNGNGRGLNIGYRISPEWAIRAEFAKLSAGNGEPAQASGKQERYENLLNQYLLR